MKNKILKWIAVIALTATATAANPKITAMKVSDTISVGQIGMDDAIWDKVKGVNIALYPQTTVRMSDKKANALNAENKGKLLKVAAIYNNDAIAFKVKWADETQNIQSGIKSDDYPDGFALQIATKFDDPKKLPYIGMGSKDRPVLVYLQKAVKVYYEPNGNRDISLQINRSNTHAFDENLTGFDKKVSDAGFYDYQKVFLSEGFKSIAEIKDDNEKFSMEMEYNATGWTGLLAKPLQSEIIDLNLTGAFPVAFALWDGEKMDRGGLKNISAWTAVRLEGKKGGRKLIAALTAKPKGDAKAGKANVEAKCVSCHTLNAKEAATLYMAPDLSNVGGYSTIAYLAESIRDPSAVIVPGYNRNAHKNFVWYTMDENGTRVSTMPTMVIDTRDINNTVAYLSTLKAKVKK